MGWPREGRINLMQLNLDPGGAIFNSSSMTKLHSLCSMCSCICLTKVPNWKKFRQRVCHEKRSIGTVFFMDMNINCTTNTRIVTVTAVSLDTSFGYVTQGKTYWRLEREHICCSFPWPGRKSFSELLKHGPNRDHEASLDPRSSETDAFFFPSGLKQDKSRSSQSALLCSRSFACTAGISWAHTCLNNWTSSSKDIPSLRTGSWCRGSRRPCSISIPCIEPFHHARYYSNPSVDLPPYFRTDIWYGVAPRKPPFPPATCTLGYRIPVPAIVKNAHR